MRYYRWLPLIMLAFAASAHALQPRIEIVEQFDSLRMVAFINIKDINDSPKWNPNIAPPPLTIAEAIKAVTALYKTSKNVGAIKEIELRPIPRHQEHWHYLIKVTNSSMKTKYNIYLVLMNGKVIPAIIEPQSYK